ncbi:hypothetical protein AYL99_00209 [Fonsecaea erecta]|uniref:Uncharacterized protein n=1 Tax=Fonsecaea erecta TaxID=1367422 RepID=A0A178ZX18_9EURO|nr:hypothetical protein AYL99_00209 [Fonsecaea erecta]OAP64237.1 hypothetical protein AYL99_00209 [Fonsecaea erecta]
MESKSSVESVVESVVASVEEVDALLALVVDVLLTVFEVVLAATAGAPSATPEVVVVSLELVDRLVVENVLEEVIRAASCSRAIRLEEVMEVLKREDAEEEVAGSLEVEVVVLPESPEVDEVVDLSESPEVDEEVDLSESLSESPEVDEEVDLSESLEVDEEVLVEAAAAEVVVVVTAAFPAITTGLIETVLVPLDDEVEVVVRVDVASSVSIVEPVVVIVDNEEVVTSAKRTAVSEVVVSTDVVVGSTEVEEPEVMVVSVKVEDASSIRSSNPATEEVKLMPDVVDDVVALKEMLEVDAKASSAKCEAELAVVVRVEKAELEVVVPATVLVVEDWTSLISVANVKGVHPSGMMRSQYAKSVAFAETQNWALPKPMVPLVMSTFQPT